MSRLIAIGDIHGCSRALHTLLREIDLKPQDTLVTLGDYVDRGPDSAAVLEMMVDLVSRCRLVPLIGNHELMMVRGIEHRDEFDFWQSCGGAATLASYGGRISNIPSSHRMFLNHCVRYFEAENHFFVHANYDEMVPLAEQPDEILFWTHIQEIPPGPHLSGKKAIVGHTPQADGEVNDMGHVCLIDTFCYGGGWLTAVEVNSAQVWQANDLGELRNG